MYDYAADVNIKRLPTSLDFWPENGDSALHCSAKAKNYFYYCCSDSALHCSTHSHSHFIALLIQHCSSSDFHFKTNMTSKKISCEWKIRIIWNKLQRMIFRFDRLLNFSQLPKCVYFLKTINIFFTYTCLTIFKGKNLVWQANLRYQKTEKSKQSF